MVCASEEGCFRYRLAYAAILFLSFGWCFLFFSVPLLSTGETGFRKVAGFIVLFFSRICHQAPDRSFCLLGQPLAVCSRCTGIYVGFLLGVIVYPFFKTLGRVTLPGRRVLLLGVVPTVLEVLLVRLGLIQDDPMVRSVTGSILGGVVAFYVLPAVFDIVNLRTQRMRSRYGGDSE